MDNVDATMMQVAGNMAGQAMAVADSRAGREFNREEAEKARQWSTSERLAVQEYNLDMWNRANEWNLAQWNRENEYNSPAAQLARAQAAGINPNSLFGNSAIAGNSNSSLKSSPVSSTIGSGASASYNSGLAPALVSAGSTLGINTANMLNALAERNQKVYNLSYDQMTQDQRIKILEGTYKQIMADVGLKDTDERSMRAVLPFLAAKESQQLKNLAEDYTRLYNENKNLIKDIEVKDANIRNTDAQTELFKEQKNTEEAKQDDLFSSSLESGQRAWKIQQESVGVQYDNKLKELEVNVANDFAVPVNSPEHIFLAQQFRLGNLGVLLQHVYRNLERVKWTPKESETGYETNHGINLGFLGQWGVGSSHRNTNMDDIDASVPKCVEWNPYDKRKFHRR